MKRINLIPYNNSVIELACKNNFCKIKNNQLLIFWFLIIIKSIIPRVNNINEYKTFKYQLLKLT